MQAAAKFALACGAFAWPLLAGAATRSCGADLRGARTLESERYVVAYRTQPPKVVVGKHFVVEFPVCPKADAPEPAGVAVDAYMSEHTHGMNYKSSVQRVVNVKSAARASSAAYFRADGLMFHMPGRWDLYFDVRAYSLSDMRSEHAPKKLL